MRNITTNKIWLIIIFLFSVLLISCKNKKKECDLYDLVQRYYSGEDISIIDDVINSSISNFSTLQDGIVCGGSQLKLLEENHLETLWFFFNEKDYTQDMLVFYIHLFRVKKTEEIIETLYIIKDYRRIPAFSEFEINYYNVSYGDPIIKNGYTRYNIDENIYGIYAYEGKYPPYNKKVKPKFLVYVENEKLVVKEPNDDKYFIYRIPEL